MSDILILIEGEWIPTFTYNRVNNGITDHFSMKLVGDPYQNDLWKILRMKPPIRVVSILDGPFLFEMEMEHLNEGVCTENAMVCRKLVRNGTSNVWTLTCCFGYSVDLTRLLSKTIGADMEMYLVEDDSYGGFDVQTNTFNGLIGDVISGKADIALAGLTINKLRSNYVDFTVPFMRTEIGILTLKSTKTNNNYLNLDFIANLADETKYAIIALYTLSLFILCAIDNCALYFKDQFDRRYRNKQHDLYPVEECFTYISGLSFQRDLGGKNPRSYGGRATAVYVAFGMMAVSTVYTASLTASKVVVSTHDNFKGLKDEKVKLFKSQIKSHQSQNNLFNNQFTS